MINLSDDSEDEGAEEEDQLTPFTPFSPKWDGGNMAGQRRQTIATVREREREREWTHSILEFHLSFCVLQTLTVGESTANTFTFKPRPLDLYLVGEDCAPPKENEGILYIRKGQVCLLPPPSSLLPPPSSLLPPPSSLLPPPPSPLPVFAFMLQSSLISSIFPILMTSLHILCFRHLMDTFSFTVYIKLKCLYICSRASCTLPSTCIMNMCACLLQTGV